MLHEMRAQVQSANERLTASLLRIRAALNGQTQFQEGDVRDLAAPIAEMAPLLEHAKALGKFDPELGNLLDIYSGRLTDIQRGLDKLGVMLLATQSSLLSAQTQIDAVTEWSKAYRQTG